MSGAELHVALDDEHRIAEDVDCRRCGYNLRGLEIETVCPECRTAVGWSVKGDLLKYANPNWVETLARGTDWLVGAVVLMVFQYCMPFGGAGIEWLLSIATVAVAGFGVFMLTLPERSGDFDATWSRPRLARVAISVALLCALIPSGMLDNVGLRIPFAVWLLSGIAGVTAFAFVALHLRDLARRIPDPKLERWTKVATVGYLVPMIGIDILFPIYFIASLSGLYAGQAMPGIGVITTLSIVFGLTSLIFGCVIAYTLIRYRKALHRQAELARLSWYRFAVTEDAPSPTD